MRSGLNRESLVVPQRVVAHIHLIWCEVRIHKAVQSLRLGSCLEVANEGVVVPFIIVDGIGTCIPLNPIFEVGKGDVGFRCL